jgi:hypothetical protein
VAKGKNGTAKAAGKAGQYDVQFTVKDGDKNVTVPAVVKVTAESITAVRKAIATCTTLGKDGKPYPGAHSAVRVDVEGESVNLTDLLIAIGQTYPMIEGKTVNGDLDASKRRLAVRAITAGFVAAGAVFTRPVRGGIMFYLPENAPTSVKDGGSSRGNASKALASILS